MTSTEPRAGRPYVADDDFRQAMTGHESEVLNMLGIPATSLQGDDIVREAMKAWGVDRERAKLGIVKHCLRRPDLIRSSVEAAAPAAGDGSGSRSELGDAALRAPESDASRPAYVPTPEAPIASPGAPGGTAAPANRANIFDARTTDAEPASGNGLDPERIEPALGDSGGPAAAQADAGGASAPQPLPSSGNGAGPEELPPPETPQSDATAFLRLVLPRNEGLRYCLAVKYGKDDLRHRWSPKVEALPREALVVTAQRDCWFACAGYGAKNKRTGENAICAGAFWLDLDYKSYADEPAARAALQRFLAATNLPEPVTVASGGGLHLWWPLREPVAKEAWIEAARGLKELCRLHDFHADPARTADIASIMRLPGTLNHKYDPPRLVVWDEREDDFDTDEFLDLLKAALARAQPKARAARPAPGPLGAAAANVVAEHCAQIGALRDSRGNVSEPEWYAALGVIAHCADGERFGHEWSSGYPQYTFEETAKKLEHARTASGPTTCERFHGLKPAPCEACPHWQQITSPIVLGRTEPWPLPNPDLLTLQTAAPSFPVDLLSEPWFNWSKAAANAAGCAIDFVVLSLFYGASVLIGNSRRVTPWAGWEEPVALFTALVGDPSSNKSPALDPIRKLLVKLQEELNLDWPDRLRQHKRDYAIAKAAEKVWKEKVKTAMRKGEPPPERPIEADLPKPIHRRRIFTVSPTAEQAARLVEHNPRGMGMGRDELAGWIGDMDRYISRGSQGGDRSFWLEAYGGRNWDAERVDETRNVHVPHLLWSIVGGIQPDRIGPQLFSTMNDGMAARFLYTWPNLIGLQRPAEAPNMEWACESLRQLLHLAWEAPEPTCLPLTEDAIAAFQTWRHTVRGLEAASSGLYKGWIGKLHGLCLRLALVLTYLEWCARPDPLRQPKQIDRRHIEAASRFLHEYALPMARRVFGETALPADERDARSLAKWLVAQEPIPQTLNERQLIRAPGGPGIKDPARLLAALQLLADEGWLRPPGKSGKRGRPSGDWTVNPAVNPS